MREMSSEISASMNNEDQQQVAQLDHHPDGILSSSSLNPASPPPLAVYRRLPNKRFVYEFDKKPVYEWTQTLEECIMYIPAPPASVKVTIEATHLTVGLKNGSTAFIDEDTCHKVDTRESTWTLEDGMIVIYLQKVNKALVWEGLLQGRSLQVVVNQEPVVCSTAARLDPFQLEQVQKEVMLERWGEQYPGMDFADAEFNGSVPDPRTFMGGVEYQ